MSYFLFNGIIIPNQSFTIKGEEALHILCSRRIQVGDIVQIQDQSQQRYRARVQKTRKRDLTLEAFSLQEAPPEPILKINLFQSLIKEKALDLVIQKATELGVSVIYIFQSRYSQQIKPGIDLKKKHNRWEKIALEACKQSGRFLPPEIHFLPKLSHYEPFAQLSSSTVLSLCLMSVGKTASLDQLSIKEKKINVIIGPEGGWDENELNEINCLKIHLGPRILRSETAAISVVSILQFLFGDMKTKPIPGT